MTAAPRPAVSAIVIAGGRSARFGRDKLAEPIGGRPLLDLALEAVAPLVAEVLLVVAPGHARTFPSPGLPAVRLIHDPVAFAGPGPAVGAALDVAREPMALVVGGDMPRMVRAVLELMVRTLVASDPDAVEAVVLARRGRRHPLPVALRVGAGAVAAQHAAAARDGSLMGILANLRVRELAEQDWRPLDPGAQTLADVDRPEDLRGLG